MKKIAKKNFNLQEFDVGMKKVGVKSKGNRKNLGKSSKISRYGAVSVTGVRLRW